MYKGWFYWILRDSGSSWHGKDGDIWCEWLGVNHEWEASFVNIVCDYAVMLSLFTRSKRIEDILCVFTFALLFAQGRTLAILSAHGQSSGLGQVSLISSHSMTSVASHTCFIWLYLKHKTWFMRCPIVCQSRYVFCHSFNLSMNAAWSQVQFIPPLKKT